MSKAEVGGIEADNSTSVQSERDIPLNHALKEKAYKMVRSVYIFI